MWVYNITDKVYSELTVCKHLYYNNLTYLQRTGREQNYLPPLVKFVPSMKLARKSQYGANDIYYTLQRNTWYDKLRDFKNSVISRILWKIKGDIS